ncbi:MAG: glycosyltransferase [Opitutae bacterium]|nr:glycosyltransferase [Opitutae bacterium]
MKKDSIDPRLVALPRAGGEKSKDNRQFFEMFLAENKIDAVLWWPGGSRKFPFVDICRVRGAIAVSCNRGQPDYYRRSAWSKACGFDSRAVRGVFGKLFLKLKLWWKDCRHKKVFYFNTEHSDVYLLLSENYFEDFRSYFPEGKVPCRLAAIGNICAFPPVEVDFSAKEKELLFVGRLKFADKRPDYLIRIWSQLEARFPDWSLRLVGSGKDEVKLRELAAKLGLKRVFFEGFQKPQEYYRRASIFCMTSAYEGFPNVLVEAANYGCVPVAFDSFAAVHDIIEDGENGLIVPAFDFDKYTEKLARLMSDSDLRGRLARNALKINEKFSPKEIGDKWMSLLSSKN